MLAGLALAELRKVLEVDLHVAAHEEVEVAIAVVVREAAARGPATTGHPRALRDVLERAVVVVPVEVVRTERGHVEVVPAVAVHVGHAHAHPPARVAHPRLVRDVLELSVPEVPIERAARGLGILGRVHGQGVHEVDVHQPVVVEIEESHAAAHRLHDVLLLRGRVMLEGDAGLEADVAEE
jgi:hypothetical protein